MQQRPQDPNPVAGQPRPRRVQPHWIDAVTKLISYSAVIFAILTAATKQGH